MSPSPGGFLIARRAGRLALVDLGRTKANRTLAVWAPNLVPPRQRIGAESLRLHDDLSVEDIRHGLAALRASGGERPLPLVDKNALKGLRFFAALPEELAQNTLAARTANWPAAETGIHEKSQIVNHPTP